MKKEILKPLAYFSWIIILILSCKTQDPVTKVKGPRNIEKGSEVTLIWTIEKADSIILEGHEGYLEPEGSITFKPDTTTTYRFIVHRGEYVKNKRFKVNVYSPRIHSYVIPDSVSDEQEVNIQWRTEHAKYVNIPGIADSLPPVGDISFPIDTTIIISIIAYGNYDTTSVTKNIKIWYEESLDLPASLFRGFSDNIYWKFKNCEYITLKGIKDKYKAIDTLKISPNQTRDYIFYVHRTYGDIDTINHSVTVKSPRIRALTAPKFVKRGEPYSVKWNTAGARYALLDGEDVAPSGQKKYTMKGSTEHNLVIYDGKIPIIKTLAVHELPQRAFVTNIDTDKSHVPGQRVDVDIIGVDQSKYPKELKLHLVVVDSTGHFISNVAPPFAPSAKSKRFFTNLMEKVAGKDYRQKFNVKEIRHDTTVHYDIAMVLDHSGSMSGEIKMLHKASIEFIQHKYPRDRISVVKFDNDLGTMTTLEENIKKILDESQFHGLDSFGGGTALYAATDEGIINLTKAANQKVVVLFTDGYENSSFQHFGRRAFHPNQVAHKLRKQGIRLFIISYGDNVNQELLSELAYLSGGKHYNILRKKDIIKVFKELPRVFRHYYEITFTPREEDGQHYLRLTYNDQVGNFLFTETQYYIGEKWNLEQLEGLEDTIYLKHIPPDKKIIVNSQTVATFDFDKDTLKMKYYPVIDSYVEYLNDNPNSSAIIAGHTDTKGSDEYCYDLSERRGNAVRDYILDKGIDKNRLEVKGYGKDQLIWEDDAEEWKGWENRRVEVLIYE